jgi:hypothetical protein
MEKDLIRVVRQIPLLEEVMWSGKEKWSCLVYLDNYKNSRLTEEWVQYFVKGALHYEGTEKLKLKFQMKVINLFINTPSDTTDKNQCILLQKIMTNN